MNYLNEIIGFFIVLFALLFPLLKKILERKIPSEKKESSALPPIPKKPLQKKSVSSSQKLPVPSSEPFHSSLEDYKPYSKIEKRQLESNIDPHFKELSLNERFAKINHPLPQKKGTSRMESLLKKKTLEQKMVIYHEILSMRD